MIGRKNAILVGVEFYDSSCAHNLPAAGRDIELMVEALGKHGFSIEILGKDRRITRSQLLSGMRRACAGAEQDDTLILYFSGHGLHYQGNDYLVPSDAAFDDLENFSDYLVRVDLSGAIHASHAKTVLVVVDACREGVELSAKSLSLIGWSRHQIAYEASKAVGILYGCGSGQVCQTISESLGSVFTAALVRAISSPDFHIGTVEEILDLTQKLTDEITARGGLRKQTLTVTGATTTETDFKKRQILEPIHYSATPIAFPAISGVALAHSSGIRGKGVVIGLIDTGVDADNPCFAEKTIRFRYFASNRDSGSSMRGYDPVGLGTFSSNILVSRSTGICPDADLIVAASASPTLTTIAKSINWFLEDCIKKFSDANFIVNISLGWNPEYHSSGNNKNLIELLRHLCERMLHANVLLVAPIGNDGPGQYAYPGGMPRVVGVGAVYLDGKISPFSGSRSDDVKKPDIFGFGVDITSISLRDWSGKHKNLIMSGTSFASTYVTGIAALLWSKSPSLTASQLRALLLSNAAPIVSDKPHMAGLARFTS